MIKRFEIVLPLLDLALIGIDNYNKIDDYSHCGFSRIENLA